MFSPFSYTKAGMIKLTMFITLELFNARKFQSNGETKHPGNHGNRLALSLC